MDFVEEYIIGRRSVRSYTDAPIEKEKIEKLIKACFYAPTSMNRDPRSLMIIDDKDVLAQIPAIHPYAKFAADAPLAMMVCAEPDKTIQDFFMEDCAASTQNILIAAKAMGIGSCWCAVYHTPRIKQFAKLLGTPENVIPYALIVLGYPAEEGKLPNRDLETTVHYNQW